MTVRLSISLPDELHGQLTAIAAASHVSVAAATRAILADVVPKMSGLLDYLGTVTPEQARELEPEVDQWAREMQELIRSAPAPFAVFGQSLEGNPSPAGEGAAEPAAGGVEGDES